MGDFGKFLLKAFIRKALTIAGTYLLAHGVLTDSEANGLVSSYLEELTGFVLIAISGAWTYLYNSYVRDKVVMALSMKQGSTPAQLEQKLEEKKVGTI